MIETLAYRYSSESFQWIPTWQGLDGFQKSLHPCALEKSRPSIGRVKNDEFQIIMYGVIFYVVFPLPCYYLAACTNSVYTKIYIFVQNVDFQFLDCLTFELNQIECNAFRSLRISNLANLHVRFMSSFIGFRFNTCAPCELESTQAVTASFKTCAIEIKFISLCAYRSLSKTTWRIPESELHSICFDNQIQWICVFRVSLRLLGLSLHRWMHDCKEEWFGSWITTRCRELIRIFFWTFINIFLGTSTFQLSLDWKIPLYAN